MWSSPTHYINLHFRRGTGKYHWSRHSRVFGGSPGGSTWELLAGERRPSSRIFLWQYQYQYPFQFHRIKIVHIKFKPWPSQSLNHIYYWNFLRNWAHTFVWFECSQYCSTNWASWKQVFIEIHHFSYVYIKYRLMMRSTFL